MSKKLSQLHFDSPAHNTRQRHRSTQSVPPAAEHQVQPKMATAIQVQYEAYDGQDLLKAAGWLKNLERSMSVNELAEEKKLEMLALKLTGFARQWFEALPDASKDTYAHAVEAFKGYFKITPANSIPLRRELYALRQTESQTGRQFAQEVLKKARGLQLPDSDLITIILGGLLPSISILVQTADPKTVMDLMALPACQTVPQESGQTMPPWAEELRNELKALTIASATVNTHRQPPIQPRQQQHYQQQQQQQQQQQPCLGCGKYLNFPRHKYCYNCPARNVTCHNCGKLGHFSQLCKKPKQANARQYNQQTHYRQYNH